MKLRNKGAYFVRTRANEIFTAVYFKTNYVNSKLPKSRRLEPGKVSIAFFDKKGADYVSNPVSYADLIGGIEEDMKDVYDFNDYRNADEMYDAMKKDGLMKDYKKELFENVTRKRDTNWKFYKCEIQPVLANNINASVYDFTE